MSGPLTALRAETAIGQLANELSIDGASLLTRYHRELRRLVDAGSTQGAAEASAFITVSTEARERRTTIDRFHAKRSKARK